MTKSNLHPLDQPIISYYSSNSLDMIGVPSWFPKAQLSRVETDLVAVSPRGERIEFIDYFTNFDLPSIQTENGLVFKGSLIDALAGSIAPGQYVQASDSGALSIGEVSNVTGSANATRIDGTTVNLANGDPVFQGDTVEVSSSGAVGLVFLDKTTLSLSEGGKMVLDELVYDPSTGTGSMAVDMVEGAFSFVSGEIAKTGPDAMKVSTPVATIGIRGTTVAGKAAVEGNENSFTLLQDADGGVGQISVSNAGGTQVLSQVGATTNIVSFTAPPPPPIILSAAQIQANYGTALNVLPPTPVIAPTPQAAPPPQEQQQQEVQEESQSEEEASEEVVSEEEGQTEEEGPPEGEEALLEGEEGPLEGEEGPPVGPDGEPLAEGEGPPEDGEGGPPVGPDGEPCHLVKEVRQLDLMVSHYHLVKEVHQLVLTVNHYHLVKEVPQLVLTVNHWLEILVQEVHQLDLMESHYHLVQEAHLLDLMVSHFLLEILVLVVQPQNKMRQQERLLRQL